MTKVSSFQTLDHWLSCIIIGFKNQPKTRVIVFLNKYPRWIKPISYRSTSKQHLKHNIVPREMVPRICFQCFRKGQPLLCQGTLKLDHGVIIDMVWEDFLLRVLRFHHEAKQKYLTQLKYLIEMALKSYIIMCVCVCLCARLCVWEREREGEGERTIRLTLWSSESGIAWRRRHNTARESPQLPTMIWWELSTAMIAVEPTEPDEGERALALLLAPEPTSQSILKKVFFMQSPHNISWACSPSFTCPWTWLTLCRVTSSASATWRWSRQWIAT